MRWFYSLLITIFLIQNNRALAESAQLDYSLQSFLRSFPTGFFVAPVLGVGKKFWQTSKLPYKDINPWYGYLRLSGALQSSGLVNGARSELEFFPISFFGLYTGYDHTIRDLDMQTFDCKMERCSGKITRKYFGVKFGLSYKSLLAFSDLRLQKNSFNHRDRPFADERATLLCAPNGDELLVLQSALLYKINDQWQTGPLYLHNQTEKSRNFTQMFLFSTRYVKKPWAFTAGAGTFSSRFSQEIFSVILGVNWSGDSGVRLF